MKYLSLFSGIGGFELGIGKKGTCVGYSEIDKHAIEVYQHHFPNHKNYGDITKIFEEELPDFDFLVGGFPCQSFSIAGKRRGFGDTRGTLFFDIVRILKAKRPRLFLLENVKGLVSHDGGNTLHTIVTALDGLGYDVQWKVLNSKNYGVPQNRERIFFVGHLRGTPRPEVFPFGECCKEAHEPRQQYLRADIVDEESLKIKQLNDPNHSSGRIFDTEGISPTLTTREQPKIRVTEATKLGYAIAEVGDSINLSLPDSKTRRGRVGHGMGQTLDTAMMQDTLTKNSKIRRLTPLECERLQGFPDNWTDSVSDNQRYKQCSNAVTVNVVKDIIARLLP